MAAIKNALYSLPERDLFQLFPKLPIELRFEIWGESLSSVGVFSPILITKLLHIQQG